MMAINCRQSPTGTVSFFAFNNYLIISASSGDRARVQMLERFLWIIADESYYEEEETRIHLPSLAWFRLNKYCSSSESEVSLMLQGRLD
jgi:hypothetical protein